MARRYSSEGWGYSETPRSGAGASPVTCPDRMAPRGSFARTAPTPEVRLDAPRPVPGAGRTEFVLRDALPEEHAGRVEYAQVHQLGAVLGEVVRGVAGRRVRQGFA